MKISNRIIQYSAGVFFLLACTCAGLTYTPATTKECQPASRFRVSAATTNESTSSGFQVRKISLEITLFSNKY